MIRDPSLAEDVMQETFLSAWKKLETLKEPAKFGAWVCRIAKNAAKNMAVRFQSYLPLEVVENLELASDASESPAALYASSEEQDELHRSIGSLPEKIGLVIRLHYFEGLSIAEIADRTRVSVGTVKWQLHDGRKRMRKELCAMNEKWNDTLV